MKNYGVRLETETVDGKPVREIWRKDGIYSLYHITPSGEMVRVKSGKTPLKFHSES